VTDKETADFVASLPTQVKDGQTHTQAITASNAQALTAKF
jgi:hypothetical protein